MPLAAIILGLFVVLVIAVSGFVVFGLGTGEKHDIVRAERGSHRTGLRNTVLRRLNDSFVRTRAGRHLTAALVQANLRRIQAIEYLLIAILTCLVVFILLLQVMATFYALALTALLGWAFWGVLSLLRERQREKFIAQLPEFARIMANSTGAGLSIHTALQVAANELPDPAGRELRALDHELSIGTPLDAALERMSDRIKGRDLHVLVSTLVISQRAGGSLISALRGMSETLEDRKETKREVRTIITQSSFTGYLVAGFGLGLVLIMNWISPGLIYKLTSTIIGQIGLIFAAVTYAIGIIVIRRMVRVRL